MQAAEQSGNVDLARYILDEDDEEDVDKEKEVQYNYNSKRTWAKNLLSLEDWELFKEKIGKISSIAHNVLNFNDGTQGVIKDKS
ncbi:MAG: hypothetical protein IKB51_05700 [Clostridia bacterium]|nr:hypothetical protein [Clostridia bacterium]